MKIGASYFVNIFIIIIIMLALAYGCMYLMNLLSGKRVKNKRLKVKEYLPLQPQVGLYLVSLDKEEMLVAVSNKSIQSIQKLDSIDFDDELTKATVKQNVTSSTD